MQSRSNRVFLIVSEFPPSPGGIGRHAFSLAHTLSAKSFQVTVLADEYDGDPNQMKQFDLEQGFTIVRTKRVYPFLYFLRIINALNLINNDSPDVVLVSGKFSLWIGAVLKFVRRSQVTAILHGSELRLPDFISRWLTYQSLKVVDKIVSVSTFTSNLIPTNLHAQASCVVIPNGITMAEFDGCCDESKIGLKGRPALVTIGNVTMRKGQHRVINSLPLLVTAYPKLHYHCIGVPTIQGILESHAVALKVSEYVTFHGLISDRKQMLKLARSAKLFIMLSENQANGDVEGFGIAILEANALGIPAIGARGSGIEEAIQDNYNGILVNGDDSREILEAVKAILLNYERFSMNSVSWARQHDWNSIAEKYISFIWSRK